MKTLFSLFLISALGHGEAFQIIPLEAAYTVPAGNYSPEHTFRAPRYWIVDGPGDEDSMNLVLPMELVGNEKIISLKVTEREGAVRKFASNFGKALCKGPWKEMSCEFEFENLEINPDLRDEFIRKKFSPEEQPILLAVALRFSGDPIGKVKILGPK